MGKRIFGIAAVAALIGLAACDASGCGGKLAPDDDEIDDAGPYFIDARRDAPRKEPPIEPEGDSPGGCPYTTPITAAEIEAQLKWLPPLPIQTACTQQNLDDLKALFAAAPAGTGVKYVDIKKSLGAECGACAFSGIAGPSWQVFAEEKGGAIDNRTGSCLAQLVSADCGKKRFHLDSCLDAACPEYECGADVIPACQEKAKKGACLEITVAYVQACPNESELVATCSNIFSSIAVSCAGGADAGLDASSN